METNASNTHTPGPWRIGDAGRTVFGAPNGNPSPEMVATVHGGTSDQAAILRVGIMRNNAALIAAAPDLLEACELAFERLKPGDVRKDFAGHIAKAALGKAINKAKGK